MSIQEHPSRIHRTFKCQENECENSRNLVVCIDGTSNQFGPKNTNIVELYSHITKSDRQLTYYSSGLGAIAKVTGATFRHRFSSGLDMLFGRNLHKVIMDSYRWLSDNYQNGDKIFLFGFSRGAYQVRALGGMIAQVGLLLPGNNEQIPFAFDLYSKTDDDNPNLMRPASVLSQPMTKESKKRARYAVLAKTFRKTFCRTDVHIHFVGVWDTVSSVGIGRNATLPCTTTSSDHICCFRHALALDERRVKFLPEYVYGGQSDSSNDGRIKEVWFAGCHSDVGGGNRRNENLQSGDIPLLWMRSQAIAAGLEMVPGDVMWKLDDLNKQIKSSLNLTWWPLELLPLKRLLYYNSDRHTSSPHFGEPRIILPGQKVHVSVLFKNNYKPCAQFYNNPTGWPEPMFWNDASSRQRLQSLPDLWEKDIFDETFVPMLLDDLKGSQSILDALDRLAFLASFDVYKTAISNYQDANGILARFWNSQERALRLSTAVTYCELGWDWSVDTLGQQTVDDVSELLKSNSDKDCRRACSCIPSLCKRPELLKAGLTSDGNLKLLVQLCDSTRIDKHEEGTTTVAFHSAQALSVMMKLDGLEFAKRLIDIGSVTDITLALNSDCNFTGSPVVVAVLNVVDGLAKDVNGRMTMKAGPIVATLRKLVKQFDDFVAPAATRVLCSLLPEEDLRETMLDFEILSILLDMLDRCSDETKQVACQALTAFVEYEDIQGALSQDGYLAKLAKRAQSHLASKRHGAIIALVTLGNTHVSTVRAAVTLAIRTANTIPVIINQLKRKSTALCAASALARLAWIEDVAVMVSNNESGACAAIVYMLKNRWFDGVRGEDGLQVLSELLACEPLRTAILQAGAIKDLSEMIMIDSERYERRYAGLHYLRVIARFDASGSALSSGETTSLVKPVVNALHAPQRRVQRIAMETLRYLSVEEYLRDMVVEELLNLLEDRRAGVVCAASVVLSFLAKDESVRDRVVTEDKFLNLSQVYYDGLNLDYDEKGRGPRPGEVYQSVGQFIKLMQVHEGEGDEKCVRVGVENRWFGPVPYELKKENRSGAYWFATLLRRPRLLCCGAGQRVYRGLWQEE